MPPSATFLASADSEALVFRAEGDWLLATAAELDRRLRALDLPNGRQVTLDLAGIGRLDTAGAWLLKRTDKELAARGNAVALANVRANLAPLLDQVWTHGAGTPLPHPVPAHHCLSGFVARIGEVTLRLMRRVYSMIGFGGRVAVTFAELLRHPRRLRLPALIGQMEQAGVDAMPIVGLLSFLIGIVFAYQGADQLRRFGAEIYTVNLLGIAILRELGVLLTAIIIAGRSGSAFTAQIGTMQVNQEIDAMRTIGLNPIEWLVLPRLLALVISMPLLAFWGDMTGLLGGAVACTVYLDFTFVQFFDRLRDTVGAWHFYTGMIKAPVFGFVIAAIGCFEGLQVEGSAESVGQLTTRSVVEAIFVVIVLDAVFSIIFLLADV